jgi:hypothetical protein
LLTVAVRNRHVGLDGGRRRCAHQQPRGLAHRRRRLRPRPDTCMSR